jgi:multimeric flavodoxin WrbA
MKSKKITTKNYKKMINEGILDPEVNECNILIINDCVNDSECYKKLEIFKNGITCNIDEIKLYQLNISPVSKKDEPIDGMEMIYDKIETASAIIIACDTDKKKLPSNVYNVIKRISNHYENLNNKVFGTIITGANDETINDLKLIVLKLGMVISGTCLCFSDDCDVTIAADCVSKLSEISASVNEPTIKKEEENYDDEFNIGVKDFDTITDEENENEEEDEKSFQTKEITEDEIDDDDDDDDDDEITENVNYLKTDTDNYHTLSDIIDEDDVVPYVIPVWAADYLLNNNTEQLDEEDIEDIENFKSSVIEDKGNADFIVVGDESETPMIRKSNDIEGDVRTDTVILYIEPSIHENIKLNIKPFDKWLS